MKETNQKNLAEQTGKSFSLFLASFVFLVCFYVGNAPFLWAEGFYAEQFRVVPIGEPEIELSACSANLDSLLDFNFTDTSKVLGQSSDSYWTAVSAQPLFVAQTTSGATAAEQAPTLGSVSSSTSVAPPVDASTLTPSSGTVAPAASDTSSDFFTEPVQTMKRFWEGTSASYMFIPKGGSDGLGINDFDFNIQFNFPCKCLPHEGQDGTSGYWYLSPNFGLQLWGYPENPANTPEQTFEASLGFGCKPQFCKDLGADLWIQAGLASSFKRVDCDSFFLRGRGLGTFRINDQVTALAGVIYYGRNHFKLLPAGGVHWVPNDKNDWYLVFPNPRFSHYLANLNETKWWVYVEGDIGGGRWLMSDNLGVYKLDYNDYHLGIGLQFECPRGCNGFIEIGGAFARELYAFGTAVYKPKTGFYLKTGLAF